MKTPKTPNGRKKIRKTQELMSLSLISPPESSLLRSKSKRILSKAKASPFQEQEEKCLIEDNPKPIEAPPQRKIRKARRLLTRDTTKEDTDNEDPKAEEIKNEGNETVVKKKRKTWFTRQDALEEETQSKTNKISEVGKNSSGELIITIANETLSPSLDNEANPILSSFDVSEEEVQPSTSGASAPPKRRTFELENSTTDLSVLKSMSENDSFRMNSFPSEESQDSPIRERSNPTFSKVTIRRRCDLNKNKKVVLSSSSSSQRTDSESTPIQSSVKTSMLRNVLTKEKKLPSTSKKIKTVPNFAAIHQKALEKVESLSEYKKRKDDRAKLLMSGKAPKIGITPSTPAKKTQKQLRFDPVITDKVLPPDFIPLPSTPKPKRVPKIDSEDPETPENRRSARLHYVGGNKENKTPKSNRVLAPNTNTFKFTTPKMMDSKITQTSGNKMDKQKNGGFNFALPFQLLGNKINILDGRKNEASGSGQRNVFTFEPAKVIDRGVKNPNSGLNRFGFAVDKVYRKETIKQMVVTKTKTAKVTTESKRQVIKGVRSNRRFDLLMNMRKGK